MQEIGVWMTETGPINATMSYGVEGDDSEFKLPSWASGALSGAATGAMTGIAGGLPGILAGAAAGAAIGGVTAATAPQPAAAKPAPKPQPPRPAQTAAPPARPAPPPARPAAPPATGGQSGGGQSAGGQNAAIAQALRQFAAVIPSLIQLAASTGGRAEGSDAAADGEGAWGVESFEGLDGVEGLNEGAAEWAATGSNEGAWSVP
jgi:hypothetical protein